MNADIIVKNEELQLLLNNFSKIRVDYPPTNLQLFDAELDGVCYELNLYFDQDSFTEEAKSLTWESEQPQYNDVLQCFLASGLLQYPNLDDLKEQIKILRNLKRKTVFCPDTNLFYNNFFSATQIFKLEELAFVNLCQEEMIASLNYKLTSNDIQTIKSEIRYQPKLYGELVNRKNKRSRKAANLALNEYNRYCDSVYQIIKAEQGSNDSERNDLVFVEAVKKYFEESRTYPVILTCDGILTDVCDAHGIEHFHLELPRIIQPSEAHPSQLVSLIANLSGVLGYIKVENMIIYGEFRGKNHPDEYKILFLNGKAPSSLERDLEICRQLNTLEIKK